MRGLRGNLALAPLFSLLHDSISIAPILVAWYMAHGLGATAVFTVQAIFGAAALLLEVPSGFVADALGRRAALAVGALFWPLGLLCYRLGHSFEAFVAAELILAVGVSLQSGCLSALVYDSLEGLERASEYARHEGRLGAAARWGTLLAALAGGLLARRHLAWPFHLDIATHLLLLPTALLLVEPVRVRPALRHAWSEIRAVSGRCLRPGPLLPWVLTAGMTSCVGLVGLWASLLAYRSWGLSLAWNGVLFALCQLGGVVGGTLAGRLQVRLGEARALWVIVLPGPLLLALALWPVAALAPVFALLAMAWNLSLPLLFAGLNARTESRVRATVLSVANLVARGLFVVIAPAFGMVVDHVSLRAAFFVLGGISLPALALSCLWLRRELARGEATAA